MLAGKMPVDQAVAETLPQVLAQLCESIRPFTGDSLGALLNTPETDLSVLNKIKNYTKRLSQSVGSEAEHDVTAMIYYGAIAGALVYHDQRITSFSYERLAKAFKSMLESRWIITVSHLQPAGDGSFRQTTCGATGNRGLCHCRSTRRRRHGSCLAGHSDQHTPRSRSESHPRPNLRFSAGLGPVRTRSRIGGTSGTSPHCQSVR